MASHGVSPRHRRRRLALADALSGVLGSLVAMLACYPVDVLKVAAQASASSHPPSPVASSGSGEGKGEDVCGDGDDDVGKAVAPSSIGVAGSLRDMIGRGDGAAMFRGVGYKAAHTVFSSFLYFYIHSLLVSRYRAWASAGRAARRGQVGGGEEATVPISTGVKLLLSAAAAAFNVCFTLPLDVVSARQQARASWEVDSLPPTPPLQSSSLNATNPQECGSSTKDSETSSAAKAIETSVTCGQGTGNAESRRQRQASLCSTGANDPRLTPSVEVAPYNTLSSLWSGLVPSLILCTNPAIHFTAFDAIKSSWLPSSRRRRLLSLLASIVAVRAKKKQQRVDGADGAGFMPPAATATATSAATEAMDGGLTMAEAFVAGVLAKFVATVLTYPLIRAKVMLMVRGGCGEVDNSDSASYASYRRECGTRGTFRRGTSPRWTREKDAEGRGHGEVGLAARSVAANCSSTSDAHRSGSSHQCEIPTRIGSPDHPRRNDFVGSRLPHLEGGHEPVRGWCDCSFPCSCADADAADADAVRTTQFRLKGYGTHHKEAEKRSVRGRTGTTSNGRLRPTRKSGMWTVLQGVFRSEGLHGLYKGCSLQLLHTLLKSALLMMVRERLSNSVRRMVLASTADYDYGSMERGSAVTKGRCR